MAWKKPCSLLTLLGIIALPAVAEQTDSLVSRWELRVGVFFPEYDTDVRRDSVRLGIGTRLDLEETLGLDDSDEIGRFLLAYRFARRHQVRFGYYDWSRDGSTRVTTEVRFGDTVFPIDSVIDTDFDAQIYQFRYSYWPVLKEKTAFSANIGVVTWDIELDLRSSGQIVPVEFSATSTVDELVPEVGVEVRQLLAPQWVLNSSITGIFLDLGDVEGEIFDGYLGIEYMPWKNVGIALALVYLDADIDILKARSDSTYELTVAGAYLYLPIRF